MNLANARWAGDIDFTPHSSDHVDTHKEQTFRAQGRSQGLTNQAFALRELRGLRESTNGEVATEFPLFGLAVDSSQWFSIHEQDPLIAIGNGRKKALSHHRKGSLFRD